MLADWMVEAACQGTGPELFYTERGHNTDVRAAKALCAACPVREQCLHHALVNGELFGVWGGRTPQERRRMRRARRVAA